MVLLVAQKIHFFPCTNTIPSFFQLGSFITVEKLFPMCYQSCLLFQFLVVHWSGNCRGCWRLWFLLLLITSSNSICESCWYTHSISNFYASYCNTGFYWIDPTILQSEDHTVCGLILWKEYLSYNSSIFCAMLSCGSSFEHCHRMGSMVCIPFCFWKSIMMWFDTGVTSQILSGW